MVVTRNEEKPFASESYIMTYVWSGQIGHASLEVKSSKGNEYLSLWPTKRSGPKDPPCPAVLKSFEHDKMAEARESRNEITREPEGQYKLIVSTEKADMIYEQIQNIRKQVDAGKINYIMINQTQQSNDQTENYNCSGIVEKVLRDQLNIQPGYEVRSHPSRVADTMCEMENVIKIKDEKSVHAPISTVSSALMDSYLLNETNTNDVDNLPSPSMRSRI